MWYHQCLSTVFQKVWLSFITFIFVYSGYIWIHLIHVKHSIKNVFFFIDFFLEIWFIFSLWTIYVTCAVANDDSILYAVPNALIKYHQRKKNKSLSSKLLYEDVSLTLLSCTKSLTILVKQSNLSSRTSLWDLNFYRSQYNHETLVIDIVDAYIIIFCKNPASCLLWTVHTWKQALP